MWKGITPKETKVLIDFHKKYGTRRTRMSKYVDEIMNHLGKFDSDLSSKQFAELITKQIKQAQLDVLKEAVLVVQRAEEKEVGYRRGAIVKPELVSARLIDKIRKLKSELGGGKY